VVRDEGLGDGTDDASAQKLQDPDMKEDPEKVDP